MFRPCNNNKRLSVQQWRKVVFPCINRWTLLSQLGVFRWVPNITISWPAYLDCRRTLTFQRFHVRIFMSGILRVFKNWKEKVKFPVRIFRCFFMLCRMFFFFVLKPFFIFINTKTFTSNIFVFGVGVRFFIWLTLIGLIVDHFLGSLLFVFYSNSNSPNFKLYFFGFGAWDSLTLLVSSAVSTGTFALPSQSQTQPQPQQQNFVAVPQISTNAASVAYFDESGQVFFSLNLHY